MTVETSLARAQYATNGTTGPWTVPFYFLEDEHLQVIYTDEDGNETVLTSADYSIVGAGDENGGTVTTVSAYVSGGYITILRSIEPLQETDLVDGDSLPAETVERTFDKQTMLIQQVLEVVNRALVFSPSDTEGASMPAAAARAGKLLGFDSGGQLTVTAPASGSAAELALALAGDSLYSEGGGMVGFGPTVAYLAGTLGAKAHERISVKDFGAVGNGVANDTTKFSDALAQSDSIYVPEGTYLLDGLNLDFDQRLYGPGVIKTSSGALISLDCATDSSDGLRVMFLEGNKPSFEELLHIKSLGYTAVMGYPWHFSQSTLIPNAEAAGLRVIVHSEVGTVVPGVITPKTDWDSRESVIGYYLLDEPAHNAISLSDQNAMITAYRAATSKPLFTAENTVMYGTKLIASGYDVIFADVYYANSYSAGKDPMAQYLRNLAEFGVHCSTAKVIPCVGLFNDTGFSKSQSLTTQLAETLLRFSPDGSFAVFCWDAGTTPGAYVGVRNTAAYLTAATRLTSLSMAYKPYRVEVVALGDTVFGGNNKLHLVWKNCTDGASPGLFAASGVTPWETKNVGSAIDSRQQNFADAGLLISGTGGRAGFAGMPSGLCAALLYYRNRSNAATCTANLGYSLTGGYDYTSAVSSGAVAVDGSWAGAAVLSSDAKNLPVLNAALSISTSAPFAWLSGYLVFSDAPSVSF